MEEDEHGEDHEGADEGRDVLPVGGDEEEDAGSEEDASEDEGDYHLPLDLPLAAAGSLLGLLVGADGCGCGVVEEAGGLPAVDVVVWIIH